MLVDKKEPRDAEFDEVKQKVTEAYRVEEARKRITTVAKKIASEAGTASGLSAAASAENYKAQEAKAFILGSPLGEGPTATTSEALEGAIYEVKEGRRDGCASGWRQLVCGRCEQSGGGQFRGICSPEGQSYRTDAP